MIGVHLLGGVGGLLSGMMGEVDSAVTSSSDSLRMLLSMIGCRSTGVTMDSCCCHWNGTPLTICVMVNPLCHAASTMAVERTMPLRPKKVPARMVAVSDMKVLVKEPRESFELIVRPELQSRVNNGCIAFVQSPLSLMVIGNQDWLLALSENECVSV